MVPSQDALPKTLVQFFWYSTKSYRWSVIASFVLVAIDAFHLPLLSYVLKLIIDRVNTYQGDMQNLIAALYPLALLFIVLEIIHNITWRLIDYLTLYAFPGMKSSIIHMMFGYTIDQSYRFFQERFSGNLASRISEMARGVEDTLEIGRNMCRYIIGIVVAAFLALTTHYFFSLVIVGWSVLFITLSLYLSKSVLHLSDKVSRSRNNIFGTVVDCFINAMTIRLFARTQYEDERLQRQLDAYVHTEKRFMWQLFFMRFYLGTLSALVLAIMIFLLLFMRSREMISIGDFAFIIMLCDRVIDSVWHLSDEVGKASKKLGRCAQSLTLLQIPREIVDVPDAKPLVVTKGTRVFDKVIFAYPGQGNLFNELSITIPAGQRVGLVGYSGSGKSSFVNLIIRLFDIQGGAISIDGQNISQVTQESLHKHIGFIPQDPLLFHRSLQENLQYGNLHASFEQIVQAAQEAHVDEAIRAMPHGYDTQPGERGAKLSGGQRQRIAIARAFLKDAPILILDEATSALDSVTEALIQDSLKKLMHNKTVLVVAHRLSTLLMLDRILVFDKGVIVEEGTHQELLKRNGLYARLWHSQAGGFLLD